MKIFSNIIKNPNQVGKYGNLNAKIMKKKLSLCDPAGDLLLFSGFELSNDNTRLIWKSTDQNMMIMKYIYNTLASMIHPLPKSSTNSDEQPTQLMFYQMQQNSMKSKKNIESHKPADNKQSNDVEQIQPDVGQLISRLLMSQSASVKPLQSLV